MKVENTRQACKSIEPESFHSDRTMAAFSESSAKLASSFKLGSCIFEQRLPDKFMKKELTALVAFLAIPALTLAQTASEIIDKNIAAVGGADKIAAVKTLQYDQGINLMGMDMTGKVTVVVGKSSRNDISVMGQQITTVVDGDKGWTVNPMQGGTAPQALPEDQVKMQKGNTYVVGADLATAKELKFPVELVGKEKFNDKDVFNLKVTRPEGVANYYVDASTYQLLGMKATVSVQGQPGEVKMQYTNFKKVNDLTIPSTLELNSPAMPGSLTMTLSNMVFNPTVDPAIFAMPK